MGCGDKISQLQEKLTRTILEGDHGRTKAKIEAHAGYPVKIEKILIKKTFKEDYTYIGIVVFKRRDFSEENKRGLMPRIGNLPSTNPNAGQFQVRFKYLETEDRWYFDQYL